MKKLLVIKILVFLVSLIIFVGCLTLCNNNDQLPLVVVKLTEADAPTPAAIKLHNILFVAGLVLLIGAWLVITSLAARGIEAIWRQKEMSKTIQRQHEEEAEIIEREEK